MEFMRILKIKRRPVFVVNPKSWTDRIGKTDGVNYTLMFWKGIFLCSILIFSGCSKNTNNNRTPTITTSKILTPYLLSFGSFISWEKVQSATIYDIYCNNEYIDSVIDNRYYVQELSKDVYYYIIARNELNNKKSDRSNKVLVSKNCNYSENEILDLTSKNSYNSSIPSYVRKVVIGKNASSVFQLVTILSNRNTDLLFEVNNVTINGRILPENNKYTRAENEYNLIFDINGNCSFNGENGMDGADFSDSIWNNKELNAGEGMDGTTVIMASTIKIQGNGNLSIKGGNGGNGGKGSATTTWESTATPGKGSNGGNGGSAIKTAYFILEMDENDFFTTISDGNGGKKGTPGVNGSIITGPLVTAMWDDVYDIGNQGKNGNSEFGKKIIITGQLIVN